MLLKAALLGVVSPKDMKGGHGHNLEKLWERFKANEASPVPDRFDATIRALHAFQGLRYPDKMSPTAMLIAITWNPSDHMEQAGELGPSTD